MRLLYFIADGFDLFRRNRRSIIAPVFVSTDKSNDRREVFIAVAVPRNHSSAGVKRLTFDLEPGAWHSLDATAVYRAGVVSVAQPAPGGGGTLPGYSRPRP